MITLHAVLSGTIAERYADHSAMGMLVLLYVTSIVTMVFQVEDFENTQGGVVWFGVSKIVYQR